MALPASGPISLSQIQTEFGGTNPISISEYYGVIAAPGGIPSSGPISIGNFYGQSFGYTLTISTNTYNYDLRTAAIGAGWNGTSPVAITCTVNSGVIVGSTTPGTAGFQVISIPASSTITITNNGTISGCGGFGAPGSGPNYAGQGGGHGIYSTYSLSINNAAGWIRGGGGGGSARTNDDGYSGNGGNGGGGGFNGGAVGVVGIGGAGFMNGEVGTAGALTVGGNGGNNFAYESPTTGGTGGTYAAAASGFNGGAGPSGGGAGGESYGSPRPTTVATGGWAVQVNGGTLTWLGGDTRVYGTAGTV